MTDMVQRSREAERVQGKSETKKLPKRKAQKALISFADDEEGDAAPVIKKAKFNPKLVSAGEEQPRAMNNTPMPRAPPKEKAEKPAVETREPSRPAKATPPLISKPAALSLPASRSPSPPTSPEPEQRKKAKVDDEIAALKASLRRSNPTAPAKQDKPRSALEAMIPATAMRGRKRKNGGGADDDASLAMFNAFKAKLQSAPKEEKPRVSGVVGMDDKGDEEIHAQADDEEARLCDLHFIVDCQSCNAWDRQQPEEEEEDDHGAWMSHSLSFAKDRLGKDLEWKRKTEEELVVIDPREKAQELKVAKKKDFKPDSRIQNARLGDGNRDKRRQR